MLGWDSAATARASRSKRASASGSLETRSGQHLHGDLAPEPRVPRAVDLPHPSGAEAGDQLVGTEARAGRDRHSSPDHTLRAALAPRATHEFVILSDALGTAAAPPVRREDAPERAEPHSPPSGGSHAAIRVSRPGAALASPARPLPVPRRAGAVAAGVLGALGVRSAGDGGRDRDRDPGHRRRKGRPPRDGPDRGRLRAPRRRQEAGDRERRRHRPLPAGAAEAAPAPPARSRRRFRRRRAASGCWSSTSRYSSASGLVPRPRRRARLRRRDP